MSDANNGAPTQAAPTQPTGAAAPNAQAGNQNPVQKATGDNKAPQAVTDAAKEAMRKLRLKNDDGTEEEIDEEVVLKTYKERKKHQAVASRELNEGRQARKQAEMFTSMLRDPNKLWDVLKAVGHDDDKLRGLMEAKLAEKIKYELMDPRDRDLMETKKKLTSYEELEKQKAEAQKRAHSEAMRKKYSEEYSKQFVDVLQKEKIPANKHTVAEMAKYIARAAQINFEMTPLEAAKLVREDIEARQRAIYGDADVETLVKFLGDETLQKLRAHDVARLKNPEQNLRTPDQQEGLQRKRGGQAGRMSPAEWRAFNRK